MVFDETPATPPQPTSDGAGEPAAVRRNPCQPTGASPPPARPDGWGLVGETPGEGAGSRGLADEDPSHLASRGPDAPTQSSATVTVFISV